MEYRNARHFNNTIIDCEINHPTYGWIPFTCNPTDTDAPFDVVELHIRMKNDPLTVAYVPPTKAQLDEQAAAQIRKQRNMLLMRVVDPVISNPLRWSDMTPAQQQVWIDYRRALLDIPQQDGFPHNVIWPTKPE